MSADRNFYTYPTPFFTENGEQIENLRLAYRTWGKLNADASNAVLICHALTGSPEADEWLGGLFGSENLFDPDKYFIVCINVPSSCYGSSGPKDIDPKTGKRIGSKFPQCTIRDFVRAQQGVLDHLGIRKIRFAFGASMGGMQALEFGIMDDRVQQLILVSMGKAHTPWQIAISEAQRQSIYNDPDWQDGLYSIDQPPKKGLAAARMQAMPWYRSPVSFRKKFGRATQNETTDQFAVESYINYQGDKLVGRFDAVTYVRLTKAMDSHDVSRDRGSYQKVLGKLTIPVLALGVSSDILYPPEEQKELAKLIPNGTYAELESENGHDAFLIEFEKFQDLIYQHLPELKPQEVL